MEPADVAFKVATDGIHFREPLRLNDLALSLRTPCGDTFFGTRNIAESMVNHLFATDYGYTAGTMAKTREAPDYATRYKIVRLTEFMSKWNSAYEEVRAVIDGYAPPAGTNGTLNGAVELVKGKANAVTVLGHQSWILSQLQILRNVITGFLFAGSVGSVTTDGTSQTVFMCRDGVVPWSPSALAPHLEVINRRALASSYAGMTLYLAMDPMLQNNPRYPVRSGTRMRLILTDMSRRALLREQRGGRNTTRTVSHIAVLRLGNVLNNGQLAISRMPEWFVTDVKLDLLPDFVDPVPAAPLPRLQCADLTVTSGGVRRKTYVYVPLA